MLTKTTPHWAMVMGGAQAVPRGSTTRTLTKKPTTRSLVGPASSAMTPHCAAAMEKSTTRTLTKPAPSAMTPH
jgi:hypothetical protein